MFTKRNYLLGIIIFVAVWALILAVPKTRKLFLVQLGKTNYYIFKTVCKPHPEKVRLEKLAKNLPDNPRVQAALVQHITINFGDAIKSHEDRVKIYAALIKQFPQSVWLIKDMMREATTIGVTAPKGAYVTDNSGQRTAMISSRWFSKPVIKQVITYAHLGEKREPNNSFYNWVEAMCWYGLKENDKALDALKRGSQKSAFDDGIRQNIKNRFYVDQLLGNSLIENKWRTFMFELFPQLSKIRFVNNIAIWQGAMQEKAGHHQKALDIYSAQIRLARTMLKDSRWTMNWFVARGLLVRSWRAENRVNKHDSIVYKSDTLQAKKVLFVQQARRFAKYANAHHRPAIAAQSITIAKSVTADPLFSGHLFDYQMTMPVSQLKIIGILSWFGIVLLEVILLAIFSTVFIIPIALLLRREAANSSVKPKTFDIVACIFFISLCFSSSIIFLVAKAPNSKGLLLGLFMSMVMTSQAPNLLNIFATWIPWVVFGILCIWALLSVFWKGRKSTFSSTNSASTSKNTELMQRTFVIIGQIVIWSIILTGQILWAQWILISASAGSPDILDILAIPLPILLVTLLSWYLQRRTMLWSRISSGTYWPSFFQFLGKTLLLLVLSWSLFYSVTLFASLPIRAKANTSLRHFLKVGEIGVMRESLEQRKPHEIENPKIR